MVRKREGKSTTETTKIKTMKIVLKNGIDKLLFGMKQPDVISLYGNPDKKYTDEDDNIVFLYNKLKLRLTFYNEEDFRLGYIITSNPEAELFDKKIIGRDFTAVKEEVSKSGISKFLKDEFDGYENFSNEDNWIIFQTEFNEITKFEIGAMLDKNDEFEWVFKK